MGFSMKIMPGVRIRASSRGFSAGIGPRAARVHVGTRGVGVSSGVGPFSAYGHLGGGTRRRSSGGGGGGGGARRTAYAGPSRTTLAALEREARQAEKAEQIRRVTELERRLVTVHRERFPAAERIVVPAPRPVDRKALESRIRDDRGISHLCAQLRAFGNPPVAPAAEPVALDALRAEEEKRALQGIGMFKRSARKNAKAQAAVAARRRADELSAERAHGVETEQRRLDGLWATLQSEEADARAAVDREAERLTAAAQAERDSEQAALDEGWQRLVDNDPAVVISALEAAFADNGAPATPIDCDSETATATVTMLFGHPDLVPERTPALTPSGKPTLRKRTKSDRNDLYLNALASNVLATVKEGFAVAPGLRAIQALVVRRDPIATGGDQLVAVYAATFTREMLGAIDWNNIKPANLLDAPANWLLTLKGQADEVVPLDLRDEPDLQSVLEQLAEILSIPPLRPKVSRGARARSTEDNGRQADGPSALDAAARNAAPKWTYDASRSDTAGARPSAPEPGPAQAPGLDSPDADVRYEAITRLRERHDPALIDTFVRTLGDADPFVRREAAAALGDLEDRRCRPVLATLLDDADADIRYEAISGLRAIPDASLSPALRRRTEDSDPHVRRIAVSSLGEIDPQGARPLLRALASDDPDAEVRYEAVVALADQPVPDDGDALVRATGDHDGYVRRSAISGLGKLADPRYTDRLIELTSDADRDVRCEAVGALGETGGPGAEPALRAALDDADRDVAEAARWALGDLGR
jgi:HEAT repeat protein